MDDPNFAGLQLTEFEKSVKMSTYLACFIVCDCVYETATLESGKLVSVLLISQCEGHISDVHSETERV